jgi:hypothetical protein
MLWFTKRLHTGVEQGFKYEISENRTRHIDCHLLWQLRNEAQSKPDLGMPYI